MPGDTSRANGKLGRGPKTPEGKRVVRFNRLQHGLFTSAALVERGIFVERRADLARHRRDVFDAFQPVGAYEKLLVDRIAALLWRLRRPARVEAAAFAAVAERVEHAPRCAARVAERALAAQFEIGPPPPACDCGAASRIEDRNGAERRFTMAVERLDVLRSVVRSEAHLSRELTRTWALLASVQRLRGAAPATPPP
ncbi:MAG: hypothetical protein QME96_15085, partial [Myxococcota bacterium]|nr:hypothetical protein [Myxococcota bacterium]